MALRASGTGTGCQKSQHIISAPAGDSSAGTPGQECHGCPGCHMANSPGATPSEFIGLVSTVRSDTAGLRGSCDCKINQQASTFVLDQCGVLHTATGCDGVKKACAVGEAHEDTGVIP